MIIFALCEACCVDDSHANARMHHLSAPSHDPQQLDFLGSARLPILESVREQ
jgi:hypothetical protein